jgi:hypothetical protein
MNLEQFSFLHCSDEILKKFDLKVKDKRELVQLINESIFRKCAKTSKDKFDVLELRDKVLKLIRYELGAATSNSGGGSEGVQEDKDNVSGGDDVLIGTCEDMCPEKERYSREVLSLCNYYEMRHGTSTIIGGSQEESSSVDHRLMIKEYSRSSADQDLPLSNEMRPLRVLYETMVYLMKEIIVEIADADYECNTPSGTFNAGDWYDFVWNRTRSIRKDIIQQRLLLAGGAQQMADNKADDFVSSGLAGVLIIEQCARFHIMCAYRLCEMNSQVFDFKINEENLKNCFQSLRQYYETTCTTSSEGSVGEFVGAVRLKPSPNEAEFRAYIILLNLNESNILIEIQRWPRHIRHSRPVRFALSVYFAFNAKNYIKFFRLVESNQCDYLQACIAHRYFYMMRSHAFRAIFNSFRENKERAFPLSKLTDMLGFDASGFDASGIDVLDYCDQYALEIDANSNVIMRSTLSFDCFKLTRTSEEKLKFSRCPRLVDSKFMPMRDLPSAEFVRTASNASERVVQVISGFYEPTSVSKNLFTRFARNTNYRLSTSFNEDGYYSSDEIIQLLAVYKLHHSQSNVQLNPTLAVPSSNLSHNIKNKLLMIKKNKSAATKTSSAISTSSKDKSIAKLTSVKKHVATAAAASAESAKSSTTALLKRADSLKKRAALMKHTKPSTELASAAIENKRQSSKSEPENDESQKEPTTKQSSSLFKQSNTESFLSQTKSNIFARFPISSSRLESGTTTSTTTLPITTTGATSGSLFENSTSSKFSANPFQIIQQQQQNSGFSSSNQFSSLFGKNKETTTGPVQQLESIFKAPSFGSAVSQKPQSLFQSTESTSKLSVSGSLFGAASSNTSSKNFFEGLVKRQEPQNEQSQQQQLEKQANDQIYDSIFQSLFLELIRDLAREFFFICKQAAEEQVERLLDETVRYMIERQLYDEINTTLFQKRAKQEKEQRERLIDSIAEETYADLLKKIIREQLVDEARCIKELLNERTTIVYDELLCAVFQREFQLLLTQIANELRDELRAKSHEQLLERLAEAVYFYDTNSLGELVDELQTGYGGDRAESLHQRQQLASPSSAASSQLMSPSICSSNMSLPYATYSHLQSAQHHNHHNQHNRDRYYSSLFMQDLTSALHECVYESTRLMLNVNRELYYELMQAIELNEKKYMLRKWRLKLSLKLLSAAQRRAVLHKQQQQQPLPPILSASIESNSDKHQKMQLLAFMSSYGDYLLTNLRRMISLPLFLSQIELDNDQAVDDVSYWSSSYRIVHCEEFQSHLAWNTNLSYMRHIYEILFRNYFDIIHNRDKQVLIPPPINVNSTLNMKLWTPSVEQTHVELAYDNELLVKILIMMPRLNNDSKSESSDLEAIKRWLLSRFFRFDAKRSYSYETQHIESICMSTMSE